MKAKVAVRKGVIPAAGRGTRVLPISKSLPKEMLPLVDQPAIEMVAREAGVAGLTDLAIVTRLGKEAIENYFDADEALEESLESAGKTEELARVLAYRDLPQCHFLRQGRPQGLGHAVAQAASHVGQEPFAVLLPDDIFHPEDPLLRRMIAVRQALGGSVVALIEVDEIQAGRYGSPDVVAVDFPGEQGQLFALSNMVEKPELGQVRSQYAMVGRYVFDPAIFRALQETPPGKGGEIQLTDAINTLSTMDTTQGGGVWGLLARGRRFDIGDTLGYVQTVIELGLEDAQIGPALRAWLTAKDYLG